MSVTKLEMRLRQGGFVVVCHNHHQGALEALNITLFLILYFYILTVFFKTAKRIIPILSIKYSLVQINLSFGKPQAFLLMNIRTICRNTFFMLIHLQCIRVIKATVKNKCNIYRCPSSYTQQLKVVFVAMKAMKTNINLFRF